MEHFHPKSPEALPALPALADSARPLAVSDAKPTVAVLLELSEGSRNRATEHHRPKSLTVDRLVLADSATLSAVSDAPESRATKAVA
jgi:hypothetical protein